MADGFNPASESDICYLMSKNSKMNTHKKTRLPPQSRVLAFLTAMQKTILV